jgi:hypothetical protein
MIREGAVTDPIFRENPERQAGACDPGLPHRARERVGKTSGEPQQTAMTAHAETIHRRVTCVGEETNASIQRKE